jgi:hypothetical protein
MADNINLFGKKCGKTGAFEFRKLQQYISTLGLSVFPQSYNNICKKISEYCAANKIKSEAELIDHINRKSEEKARNAEVFFQSRQNSIAASAALAQAVQQPSPVVINHPPPPAVRQPSPVVVNHPPPPAVRQPSPVVDNHPPPPAVQQPSPVVVPQPIPFQQLSDLDILLTNDLTTLFQHTDAFQNLDKYTRTVQQIGEVSRNGFIRKLQYESEGNRYSIVLKSNVSQYTDNLVYEYLVGLCINEFSKYFPCFAKSYMIGTYRNDQSQLLFRNIVNQVVLPNNLNEYIQPLDTSNLNQIVKTGCENNRMLCLFMQHIPVELSVAQFLDTIYPNQTSKLYELAAFLHITYSMLSSLADYFTHYDLHTSNIVLVKIPNNQFVNIRIHLPNGIRIVSYKSIYLPVIIDYGHIFANCQNLNNLIHNSNEIIQTTCNFDSTNPIAQERVCKRECGDDKGYNWLPIYNYATRSFNQQTPGRYYIDPTRRNISHDVKLLNYIKEYLSRINFAGIRNSTYIGQSFLSNFLESKIINMQTDFGSSENISANLQRVYNVYNAFSLINEIVDNPEFNTNNDLLFVGKTLYKTIDIWHGPNVNRPFVVS